MVRYWLVSGHVPGTVRDLFQNSFGQFLIMLHYVLQGAPKYSRHEEVCQLFLKLLKAITQNNCLEEWQHLL